MFVQTPSSRSSTPAAIDDRHGRRVARSRRGVNDSGGSFSWRAPSHERLPDQRRERAARDRVRRGTGRHRHELVRVADPDGGDELRRVADEPRVAVVLGRAGLAGDLPAGQRAALPVPYADDALQHVVDDRRLRLGQHRLRDGVVDVRLAVDLDRR